jgi:hypothetical protein
MNRRTFLKGIFAAVGASVLAPALPPSAVIFPPPVDYNQMLSGLNYHVNNASGAYKAIARDPGFPALRPIIINSRGATLTLPVIENMRARLNAIEFPTGGQLGKT